MREDGGIWQRAMQGKFDLLSEVVASLYRPCAWHQDMHRDEAPGGRLPRAQGVKVDAAGAERVENGGDRALVFGGQGSVEQA